MTTQTLPWKKHHLKQEGAGYTVFTVFNTFFLLLVIFITAYPVYYVVVASLYIRIPEKYPLQLVLRQILILNENTNLNATMTDNGDQALYANQIKYALIVVSTLPILVLYPFLQKFFDKGVMIGALKE